MLDPAQRPQLRRTWLRGYRTSDVELLLAQAQLTLERLQHENGAARSRAQAMQTEIDELHGRIDGFRRREAELDQAIAELRRERDALERQRETLDREAQSRSEGIVAEAETRAATLRTEALRQVSELQEQVEQLLALRASLTDALRKAGGEIGRTLEEVESTPDHMPGEATLERPAEDLAARLQRLTRDEP